MQIIKHYNDKTMKWVNEFNGKATHIVTFPVDLSVLDRVGLVNIMFNNYTTSYMFHKFYVQMHELFFHIPPCVIVNSKMEFSGVSIGSYVDADFVPDIQYVFRHSFHQINGEVSTDTIEIMHMDIDKIIRDQDKQIRSLGESYYGRSN